VQIGPVQLHVPTRTTIGRRSMAESQKLFVDLQDANQSFKSKHV